MDSVTVYAQTLNNIIYNCGKIRGNYCNTTEITGELINEVIPLLSFNGLTGPIAFNQTKPDRRSMIILDSQFFTIFILLISSLFSLFHILSLHFLLF